MLRPYVAAAAYVAILVGVTQCLPGPPEDPSRAPLPVSGWLALGAALSILFALHLGANLPLVCLAERVRRPVAAWLVRVTPGLAAAIAAATALDTAEDRWWAFPLLVGTLVAGVPLVMLAVLTRHELLRASGGPAPPAV